MNLARGAMPLSLPLLRFTIDGRKFIGDCTFFASTDLELFAKLLVLAPRDGLWGPGNSPGRLRRVADVPGSLPPLLRSLAADRGRAGVWLKRPDVRLRGDDAPTDNRIVPWSISTHDATLDVDGRKVYAIESYGAGADITWRIDDERRILIGWWGDDTTTPVLAVVVMGLG